SLSSPPAPLRRPSQTASNASASPPWSRSNPAARFRQSAARRSGSATVSPPIRNSSATRSGLTSLRPAAGRLKPHRPEQRAALERPDPGNQVPAPVAGPVVDRAQEQRRSWIRDLRETRRLVGIRELAHSLGHSLDRLLMHPRPERRRVAGYHQTTESMPSSSSTGFV